MYVVNVVAVNISMLTKTKHTGGIKISPELIDFIVPGKHDLTKPTGQFFYDPWTLTDEYKNTPLGSLWNSLPGNKGQSRLIVLESPSCYTQHADIDDRYHLSMFGDEDYIIDLDNQVMHKLTCDGTWYEMDAGRLHTAISIGEHIRIQMVVRKLLTRNILVDPVSIKIIPAGDNPRYHFDNKLSPWLNQASKCGIINNFERLSDSVCFEIERNCIHYLTEIIPERFTHEIR